MTIEHERSSGNVFADMGLPDADQELVKARLTVQIHRLLKERGLTQVQAAKVLGATQAQVSALTRLRPASVSVGRLMKYLTILGQDIEIRVTPTVADTVGHMAVLAVDRETGNGRREKRTEALAGTSAGGRYPEAARPDPVAFVREDTDR